VPLTPLKVALVGCGRMGAFTRPELRESLPPGWLPLNHAEAIIATPGLRLDSVCDSAPENLERACSTFKVRGYADFARQIGERLPDIVSIATRTTGRGEIIGEAIRHGVRGLHCEKPLANNMRQCRAILSAIAARDIKFTYGTTRRFMDIYRLGRSLVQQGEIGALTQIEVQFGRTLLLWNHPHSIDLLLFFSGRRNVRRVQARITLPTPAEGDLVIEDDPFVEDATIEFDDGVIGRLSPVAGLHVVLAGTRGTLQIGEDGRWLEICTKQGSARRLPANPTMSGTMRAFCELEQAIRTKGETPMDPRDVEAATAILLAIARSGLNGGTPLHPNELDQDFTVRGRFGANYA
jgi:scyllo-inositol 2-dehydrogenase (NAD+)